jgi:hypothetical protein
LLGRFREVGGYGDMDGLRVISSTGRQQNHRAVQDGD